MSKKSIENLLEQLICYAQKKLYLKHEDTRLVRNRLLFELKINNIGEPTSEHGKLQEDILDPLIEYAISKKLTTHAEKLLFETRLLGLLMPMPSVVREHFDDIAYEKGVDKALSFLYDLSVDSNYIRMVDIDKNMSWEHKGPMGDIGITINLSKPEKDPKEIALLLKEKKHGYPLCMLCAENVGFYGSLTHPSRATLRTIPILLADENWHFQYSPYSYFREHCIALADIHSNMQVNEKTYRRLFDFVELFTDYFIGSNAALPIVGGSILNHDHYQGGLKVLPLMKALDKREFSSNKFSDVKITIVNWYNSVIRVSSSNREQLLDCINYIGTSWDNYSDESVNILAKTKEQHNAITPIARIEKDAYILDMILRNNRTDDKHPYGIFHPSEELHNIKKEGIGLIEAMGKFILPGRLASEAFSIKEYLTGEKAIDFKELARSDNNMNKHISMIAQLANDHGVNLSEDAAGDAITDYINQACVKILECTAVFKNNDEGQAAFIKFIKSMGFSSNSVDDYALCVNVERDKEIKQLKKKKTVKKNNKVEN